MLEGECNTDRVPAFQGPTRGSAIVEEDACDNGKLALSDAGDGPEGHFHRISRGAGFALRSSLRKPQAYLG